MAESQQAWAMCGLEDDNAIAAPAHTTPAEAKTAVVRAEKVGVPMVVKCFEDMDTPTEQQCPGFRPSRRQLEGGLW